MFYIRFIVCVLSVGVPLFSCLAVETSQPASGPSPNHWQNSNCFIFMPLPPSPSLPPSLSGKDLTKEELDTVATACDMAMELHESKMKIFE